MLFQFVFLAQYEILTANSPTWSSNGNDSYRAVDGNMKEPCMLIRNVDKPWWAVDMGREADVTKVKIKGSIGIGRSHQGHS